MELIITITSILSIASALWLVKKFLNVNICPICAGVSLTWILGLLLIKMGVFSNEYLTIVSILMGGTVVGLMNKLESRILPSFILLWKTIFCISGFSAVFGIISDKWSIVIIAISVLVIASFLFRKNRSNAKKHPSFVKEKSEIEKKMENCC